MQIIRNVAQLLTLSKRSAFAKKNYFELMEERYFCRRT